MIMNDQETQPAGKKIIATKVMGKVKWFNGLHGFINRDDTKEDVFVYYNNIIHRKRRKTVRMFDDFVVASTVKFDVIAGEKGNEAINVTGPDGKPLGRNLTGTRENELIKPDTDSSSDSTLDNDYSSDIMSSTDSTEISTQEKETTEDSTTTKSPNSAITTSEVISTTEVEVPTGPLTQDKMEKMIDEIKKTSINFLEDRHLEEIQNLTETMGSVLTDPLLLSRSFPSSNERNSMEEFKDHKFNCPCDCMKKDYEVTVDLESLRQFYKFLIDPDVMVLRLVQGVWAWNVQRLKEIIVRDFQIEDLPMIVQKQNMLESDLRERYSRKTSKCLPYNILNIIVIICDAPNELMSNGNKRKWEINYIAKLVSLLCYSSTVSLVKFFARQSAEYMYNLVGKIQNQISYSILKYEVFHSGPVEYLNYDEELYHLISFLRILYLANNINYCQPFDDERNFEWEVKDDLLERLGISPYLSRKGIIEFSAFVNRVISFRLKDPPTPDLMRVLMGFQGRNDLGLELNTFFLSPSDSFSLLRHGFILDSGAKQQLLEEFTANLEEEMQVTVRRDQIVDDALAQLEELSKIPDIFYKRLVVSFEGEMGVDYGGLRKEFFGLVIDQLFNPDYGLFSWRPESRTHWFSIGTFESVAKFELIGMLFLLAIRSGVLLDVHFPLVLYRKLLGVSGTFEDLKDFDPEYVDLFADFLLNKCIAPQFLAFAEGFKIDPCSRILTELFRPDEIALLVCGSPDLDVDALQRIAKYGGGYTFKSDTIVRFWSVLRSLDERKKREFLKFTTGSDRVPLRGKLIITILKSGPDTDRF